MVASDSSSPASTENLNALGLALLQIFDKIGGENQAGVGVDVSGSGVGSNGRLSS